MIETCTGKILPNVKKYQKKSPVYAIKVGSDIDEIVSFLGQYYIEIIYTNRNIRIKLYGQEIECKKEDYICYSYGTGYYVVDKETFEKDHEEIKDGKQ